MRLIYAHKHEGIWFSRNGHRAYMRGEKPLILWPEDAHHELVPTVAHHISRKTGSGDYGYTRKLVMFFADESVVEDAPELEGMKVCKCCGESHVPHTSSAEYWKAMYESQLGRKRATQEAFRRYRAKQ